MLNALRIQNLAVIERADIAFSSGLTAVTGESGAGKSLLIRALALSLGARADKDDCGSFAKTTIIETDFTISDHIRKQCKLIDIDIESAEDTEDTITIRRELTVTGRSRCFINDQLIRLADLTALAPALCDISGQSSSSALRDTMSQLSALDQYAGLQTTVEQLGERYDAWMSVRIDLRKLERNRESLKRERELLRFQLQELEDADLSIEEEQQLIAEKTRLDDFERLSQTCDLILTSMESDGSPVEALQTLRNAFAEVNAIDESFTEQNELFNSALIQLEEVRRGVATFHSSLSFDPQRLEEINQRLSEIYQLKNKYGGTVSNALEELGRIKQRLQALPDPEQGIAELHKRETQAQERYTALALRVRGKRHKAAGALSRDTLKELASLALEKSRFEFVLEEESGEPEVTVTIDGATQALKAHRHGLESGGFYFSANPGEAPRPLARVASGGELSRVLLSLKIAGRKQPADKSLSPVAVFDEIDTGVSGKTATAMGKKLKELANNEQTIVVTHLRQVVQVADNHLLVEKTLKAGKHHVTIRPLSKRESEREQMKMVDLEPAV